MKTRPYIALVCVSLSVVIFFAGLPSSTAIATGKNEASKEPESVTPSSNSSAEFSARTGPTKIKKIIKSSKSRRHTNSSESLSAESSKSPKVEYTPQPENDSAIGNIGSKEDEGHGVALELLDGKEFHEYSKGDSEDVQGRSHFPQEYYRDPEGPYEEYEGGPDKKRQAADFPGKPFHEGDHSPKYYYPKSHERKQSPKHGKNKKYEYKYDDAEYGPKEYQPTMESDEGRRDHNEGYGYGQEEMQGYGHHGPPHHYYGNSGVEILSKALHLLIPSALLLTGLSAVFPNRVHVPTNDFQQNNKVGPIRYKRSLPFSDEMLLPEHRSMDMDLDEPSTAPSFRNYNFEIGPPQRKIQYQHQQIPEFTEIPVFDAEEKEPEQRIRRFHHKQAGFRQNVATSPKEFDQLHHSSGLDDSITAPSYSTPTISAPPDHANLNSIESPESNKPKRKMRTRTTIKVRPGKLRSRPLPTEASILDSAKPASETQSNIIRHEAENKETTVSRGKNFKFGDEFLKSLVVDHDANPEDSKTSKQPDLSPDSPVMGLISSYAQHGQDSPTCQKRALCELAIKGKGPNASKFETFLWSLATLVPEQFSKLYELDQVFTAVKANSCEVFRCSNPNLDLQV